MRGGGAVGSLGRMAPALVLTALLVALFLRSTLPALSERDQLRRERERAEADLEALRTDVQRDEAWIQAASQGDEYVLERERDALLRSPALPGPRYQVVAPPGADDGGDAPDDDDAELLGAFGDR
jgi:cell division protein FtsB